MNTATATTASEPTYSARYGEYPNDRASASWEPVTTLDAIQATCRARNTNADLMDRVGMRAGTVDYTGRYVAKRSPYARS